MSVACDPTILNALTFWSCQETANGARIRTTCLFPAFEPVFVYVVKFGDGFIVHDAGETMAVILSNGQDGETAKRTITAECKRYDISCEERRISLKIDAAEWLDTAIVSVANAAANAARNALNEVSKRSDRELIDALVDIISPRVAKGSLTREYGYQGTSGRKYRFDLAIEGRNKLTLIQAVRPNPISVNSKFVALADVSVDDPIRKIAAHNDDLAAEDILLLQGVATVASKLGVKSIFSHDVITH